MKKILLGLLTLTIIIITAGYFLIFPDIAPRHYRNTDTPKIRSKYAALPQCSQINWGGIENLHMSGSGYLKKKHLQKLTDKNTSTILFNLAFPGQHEAYFKGYNVKEYFGIDTQTTPFTSVPKSFFRHLKDVIRRKFHGIQDITNITYQNEAEIMAAHKNVAYFQILPSDFLGDLSYMDEFIKIFETIQPDQHVYFHCNHGRGRTTTMMTLYDVYKNHKTQTIENIFNRQYCIGGIDIYDTDPIANGTWKPEALIARKNLVVYFYTYMNDPNGYGKMQWSDWLKDKDIQKDPALAQYKRQRAP